jgi:hypothetical protein
VLALPLLCVAWLEGEAKRAWVGAPSRRVLFAGKRWVLHLGAALACFLACDCAVDLAFYLGAVPLVAPPAAAAAAG